jgi:Ca2+/Na+ antiporter
MNKIKAIIDINGIEHFYNRWLNDDYEMAKQAYAKARFYYWIKLVATFIAVISALIYYTIGGREFWLIGLSLYLIFIVYIMFHTNKEKKICECNVHIFKKFEKKMPISDYVTIFEKNNEYIALIYKLANEQYELQDITLTKCSSDKYFIKIYYAIDNIVQTYTIKVVVKTKTNVSDYSIHLDSIPPYAYIPYNKDKNLDLDTNIEYYSEIIKLNGGIENE